MIQEQKLRQNMNSASIHGDMYHVMTMEGYKTYIDTADKYTAIDIAGYILPVVSEVDKSIGISVSKNDMIAIARLPEKSDKYYIDYTVDNPQYVRFDKVDKIQEYLTTHECYNDIEHNTLTNLDNVFAPTVGQTDAPAMKALKEAVIKKNIDIDKYEQRFGSNFNNDKRLFNKNNISLPMLVRLCDGLDIKAELSLSDQGEDVPNPMNVIIKTELTGGDMNE